MTQLTKQKEQLDALLVGMSFNGKSRRRSQQVLDSYIPNVARMRRTSCRNFNMYRKTAAENEKLKEKNRTYSASLDKRRKGASYLEDAKLRCKAALKTLDNIRRRSFDSMNRTREPACAMISKAMPMCNKMYENAEIAGATKNCCSRTRIRPQWSGHSNQCRQSLRPTS